MVKMTGFDTPPEPLSTRIVVVPEVVTRFAGTVAESCDALLNAVTSGVVFHFTTDDEVNPVPDNTRENALLPAVTLVGAIV